MQKLKSKYLLHKKCIFTGQYKETMLLPEELVPFEAQIIATQKACVKIIPQQASPALLWQSKIGGMPYLPKHVAFPVNAEGAQLFFFGAIQF